MDLNHTRDFVLFCFVFCFLAPHFSTLILDASIDFSAVPSFSLPKKIVHKALRVPDRGG